MVKLSFLVATYNCVADIAALDRLAREWSDLPVEFCVVDGGSGDGTVEALRQSKALRLIVSEPDRGIYDAWNKAVAAARGTYVSFIGADDVPQREFFLKACAAWESLQRPADVLYGDAILVRGAYSREWKSPEHPRLFDTVDIDFDIPHPGSYNHHRLFEKMRFDPSFRLAGDFDFYLRAAQQAHFSWLKIDAVQARIGTDGASRSPGSSRVYRSERLRAASNAGRAIAPDTLKRRVIEAIERLPFAFRLTKGLAWRIRGRRS